MSSETLDGVPHWHLKKIPNHRLDDIEKDADGFGTIYDDILKHLQIRPESCQLFFCQNLRPWRNKPNVAKLIAQGDDTSSRKLTELFLQAFGKLCWNKNRGWLLRPDELKRGEVLVQYPPPKKTKELDLEIFSDRLSQLWRRMRNTIYEIKKSYYEAAERSHSTSFEYPTPSIESPSSTQPSDTETDTKEESDMPRRARAKPRPSAKPKETPEIRPTVQYHQLDHWPATTDGGVPTEQPPRTQQIHGSRLMLIQPDGSYDRTAPRLRAPPPPAHEIAPLNCWPASRTHEAIINIIVDLNFTRNNSHPRVFEAAFEECMAQLSEWIEEDRLAEGATSSITTLTPNTDEMQADDDDQSLFAETALPNPVSFKKPPAEAYSFTDIHRPTSPLPFPVSVYMPSTLPHTMSLYITPFRVAPSSSNVQPFLWPDAPVMPESYQTFVNGIRMRANMPDNVGSLRVMFVLGYGWNDFSRLVRNEEDWKNGVMGDLKDASRRLGVRVWRARCCVFAV